MCRRCEPPDGYGDGDGSAKGDLSITLVGVRQLAGPYAQALRRGVMEAPFDRDLVLGYL
jgi:hypothetical protein